KKMENVYLGIVLAPLLGAAFVGLFCRRIPRVLAHSVAIAGVAIAFLLSLVVLHDVVVNHAPVYNDTVYTWAVIGDMRMEVGFLVDGLTALMMGVVTFVSLLVHIYTIG